MDDRHYQIRHAHLFCGLGGGAKGFNRATARLGHLSASYRCIGGIDVDPAAIRDFNRAVGVRGTLLDLFDAQQYEAWHGAAPPPDWRPAVPADIHWAFGHERPHVVFLSPPCKGFSGLLSESKSTSARYQALNHLALRGLFLMLEAYADDPPELILLENVPRIVSRGRGLLGQIGALLRHYGYAVAETSHDCGELGGLAQSRKRFLLVARHVAKVRPFLYEPPKRALHAVGDVLGRMMLPGDERAGPMHRVPNLQWQTWVRLAFVLAGGDWRSLSRLSVVDGMLRDFLLVPEMHHGVWGVTPWQKAAGTVQGASRPANGTFSVADPRYPSMGEYGQLGVRQWDQPTGTVTAQRSPIQGGFSVADPRTASTTRNHAAGVVPWAAPSGTVQGESMPSNGAFSVADPRHTGAPKFNNIFQIAPWTRPSGTVTAQHNGNGFGVADPRPTNNRKFDNIYRVVRWDRASGTVIGGHAVSDGALSVADPRPGFDAQRPHYQSGGHYGVAPWTEPAGAISHARQCHTGPFSVSDPRLPGKTDRLVARIISEDDTWHRPFTTLELAALQSLIEPEEQAELDGLNDGEWRERIGNAVPPDAAQAIGETIARTLLMAWSGEGFRLSHVPIWVRPLAVALSVAQPNPNFDPS